MRHPLIAVGALLAGCVVSGQTVETPDGTFTFFRDEADCLPSDPITEIDAMGRLVVVAEPICVPGSRVVTWKNGQYPPFSARDAVLSAYTAYCAPLAPPTNLGWDGNRWRGGECGA
ncbi:hypothetical protein [Jannaschia pohangensis]|uniref:Uncharacterized protein n=1 Tax=Jannaschia pohangensis TaxID=390807 RepID=A0A1I3Q4W3_9RHOB|nr:hypothetical protein [Jannaschia pohangensis]SFJ28457.1 hypothetical protein SAMN04488095_2405 [Jannaschia pohangensis]